MSISTVTETVVHAFPKMPGFMSTGISAVKSFVTGFFTDLMHGLPITRAIAFAHPIAAVGVAIGIGVITALAIKGIRAAISHYRAAHAVPAQV